MGHSVYHRSKLQYSYFTLCLSKIAPNLISCFRFARDLWRFTNVPWLIDWFDKHWPIFINFLANSISILSKTMCPFNFPRTFTHSYLYLLIAIRDPNSWIFNGILTIARCGRVRILRDQLPRRRVARSECFWLQIRFIYSFLFTILW